MEESINVNVDIYSKDKQIPEIERYISMVKD